MTAAKPRRSHRNTRRLTNRERAVAVVDAYYGAKSRHHLVLTWRIQRAIQAAVRQALARNDRRSK